MGDGVASLAFGQDGHQHAVPRVAADVGGDGALVLLHDAPHQGTVAATGGLQQELVAQGGLGIGRFGHDQQAGRVLVDAVDEAHVRVVGIVAGIVLQVPGDGVDQRAVPVAVAGMHHEARRLVDHQHVVVLIDDVQGDVLRGDVVLVGRAVHREGDDVQGLHAVAALHGASVGLYEAGIGGLLDAVARGVLDAVKEVLVHAHHVLPLVHHHAEVFVELCPVASGGRFQFVQFLVRQSVLQVVCPFFVLHTSSFI